MTAPRAQLADELLRRLAAALKSGQLYSPGHPIIARNIEGLSTALQLLHGLNPTVVIGIIGDEVVVDDMPIAKADAVGPLIHRLQLSGVERIAINRGVTREEISAFLDAVTALESRGNQEAPTTLPEFAHIRVGRITIEQRPEGSLADMSAIKGVYNDAVSVATSIWESASTEGMPDAAMAGTMVDGLAQAVAQNRTALLALTTLKNYDNYTFTHMVNVSALAMAQALLPRYAEAQLVSFTDPRIKAQYVTYPSPGGNSGTMRGYLVQPKGQGPFPAVLVIHENRGLNPYIEDVARRAATEGFLALAPRRPVARGRLPRQRR